MIIGLAIAVIILCVHVYFRIMHRKQVDTSPSTPVNSAVPATPEPVISKDPFSVIAGRQVIALHSSSNTVDFVKLLGGILRENDEQPWRDSWDNTIFQVNKSVVYDGMRLCLGKNPEGHVWGIEKIVVDGRGILLPTGVGIGDGIEKIKGIYKEGYLGNDIGWIGKNFNKEGDDRETYNYMRRSEFSEEYILFHFKEALESRNLVLSEYEIFILAD